MKEIKTVGIIGLGALGALYAHLFTHALGKEHTLVLADAARTQRYRQEGFFFNGEACDFQYVDTAEVSEPVDLLLFAVKFGGLEEAIASCRHLVTPETTLVSVLNGISSETILASAFSSEQVVWCVAQRMSARKAGNRIIADPLGELALGIPVGADDAHFRRLTTFLDSIAFPYATPEDIRTHMWSKLLCNTGCNQTTMVFRCGYGGIQAAGEARDTMLGAMREVVQVANAEGVALSEADIKGWLSILDSFPADGETSMRQDSKAGRKSEVELFAGTIRRLAAKHNIAVPVNDWLYQKIQEMEAAY